MLARHGVTAACAGDDDELVVAVTGRRATRAGSGGWWPATCGLPPRAVRVHAAARAAPAGQRASPTTRPYARWPTTPTGAGARTPAADRRPVRGSTPRSSTAPTSPRTAASSASAATRCPTSRCRSASSRRWATCPPTGTPLPIRELRAPTRRPRRAAARAAAHPGDRRRAARDGDRADRRLAHPAVHRHGRRARAARRWPGSTSPASTSPPPTRATRPRQSAPQPRPDRAAERWRGSAWSPAVTDDYEPGHAPAAAQRLRAAGHGPSALLVRRGPGLHPAGRWPPCSACPALDRAERRFPFAFPLGLDRGRPARALRPVGLDARHDLPSALVRSGCSRWAGRRRRPTAGAAAAGHRRRPGHRAGLLRRAAAARGLDRRRAARCCLGAHAAEPGPAQPGSPGCWPAARSTST